MGVHDFNAVYDQLDNAQKGYVTADQIMDFYAIIFGMDLKRDILFPSIESVCGSKTDQVTKEFFYHVLEEIQRRNNTETEAYWDFQALDTNGDNHIPLSSAFLLFQEYHADHFSLDYWHQFLESREHPGKDVFFDEIRYWLCSVPPKGKPYSEKKMKKEQDGLSTMQLENEIRELNDSKFFLANEELDNEEHYRQSEETQHLAKRKLNIWKTKGLEAMLNDDGQTTTDMEGDRVKHRDGLSTNDVIDALDMKYSMLQDKVITEMAAFAANMDSEKSEVFDQIKRTLIKMIKDRTLQERAHEMPGSNVTLPMTLLGMLGDLRDANAEKKNEFETMQHELEGSGKTNVEIFSIMTSKYQAIVDGSVTCSSALAQLHLRHKAEREVILSSLHATKRSTTSTIALSREYWRLLHQLRLLKVENGITPAGLGVGIAERKQSYKPMRFDWDRQRSETLANLRLDTRRGHKPIRRSTAPPDIEALKELNSMNLKIQLIEDMDQRHFYEREAIIYLLQGPDSKKSIEAALGKNHEERKRRLRTLRNQRIEWKSAHSSDLEANQKILSEAIGLYFEERHSEIEATKHNAGEDVIKATILSDLQQRQEVEFWKVIEDMDSKKLSELQKWVLCEIEAIKDEHFDNIAFVILGCVEVNADDNDYIQALDGKYMALRDQVFVFGLKDKMGSAWKDLSREEKQKEIVKLRKEEQRIRGEGDLHHLDKLAGPRSQALYPLTSLIGEDKVFAVGSPRPANDSPATNILADLVPRYDHEQESLLNWLHSDEAKSMKAKDRRVHITRMAIEKFAASSEGDYETAIMFVGLLERIRSTLPGRSKSDKERQLNLARKRAALYQKTLTNKEKMRSPAEEKLLPKDDDDNGWQAVYLRALMRRHYGEREAMLKLLLGPGLDEIVEAAALMTANESRDRIKELQSKRESLDLNDPDHQEEHFNILEEAGAIRVAGKKQAMCKAKGKAVLLIEVVHHLLAELQDCQDVEVAQEINNLLKMDVKDMQDKIAEEEKSKKNCHCNLVMKVFAKYDGDTNTSAFEKLIEEKYRHLRTFLLTESLAQQHGSKAWTKMGQKQKKKFLDPLFKKEELLWMEGNSEKLSECLHSDFVLHPYFSFLIGMGRDQYFTACHSNQEQNMIIEEDGVKSDISGKGETYTALYNRYSTEIDFVRNHISGSLDVIPSENEKALLFLKLKWEVSVIENSIEFVGASLICGLSERQNIDKNQRLQHDLERYQILASCVSDSNREVRKQSLSPTKSEDISRVQDAVIATLIAKHTHEWNVFLKLFSSSKFKNVQQMILVESLQQKSDRLSTLFKKWESFEIRKTSDQLAVLDEALVVKKEIRREYLMHDTSDVKESTLLILLFSDLLQAQLCEAQVYLKSLVVEPKDDIEDSQAALTVEISESHVTNVAEVLFASEKLMGEEDEMETALKAAVDGKYNALHDQLLIQALIDEMGEDEWRRLSEQERRRRLLELKLKERQLRKEGKFDEANALLGGLLNDEERLRQILGDNKEEQDRKLRERLERRKNRLAEGMTEEECDELETQEITQEEEEEKQKRKNILLHLEHNSEKEKEELLRKLRELEDEHEKEKQRRMAMLKLRREERRLRQENKFESAAMLLNLCKETEDRFKLSHDEERKKQKELARKRLEEARIRRLQGDNLVRGETIIVSDDEQDETKIEEAVIKVLDRRHEAERSLLSELLDAACEGDERDEARILTDDELKQQIEGGEDLFTTWKDSENPNIEDVKTIFAENMAVTIEAKKRDMQAGGEMASDEDVKTELMANLQMKQDKEVSQMLQQLTESDIDRKKAHFQTQKKMLKTGIYQNVAEVIFEAAGEKDIFSDEDKENLAEEDSEVVKALERKYDTMKDKLIMEALMKQMGEDNWSRLSELEKKKKILNLKREERRLRKEGKLDEAAALLGQYLDQTGEISRLLGESEAESKKRLQEKLELKRKMKADREAQGLETDETTLDNLADEEINKKRRNVLENLDLKLDEEKAALLASLQNQTDQFKKERERQLALAKLKREQKRLKQEEKFESAAMIFALHQETNERLEQYILNERERNRQLAKERLEARKRLKAEKEASELSLSVTDEPNADIKDMEVYLQDAVINSIEKHHGIERDTLVTILDDLETSHPNNKKLTSASDQNIKAQFTKLQKEYESWEKNTTKEVAKMKTDKLTPKQKEKLKAQQKKRQEQLANILKQAVAQKFELERRKLQAAGKNLSEEDILKEFSLGLLAMIQQKQNAYLESVSDSMSEKSEAELRELRITQDIMSREGWHKILSTSLFSNAFAFDLLEEINIAEESPWVTMEEEFEKERKELVEKGKHDNIDVESMLKDLEAKHNERRKINALETQQQREKLAQRLAQKKNEADDKNWNLAQMTSQLFDTTETNKANLNKALEDEKGRQSDLLQQRLQARRDARKQADRKDTGEISRESTTLAADDMSRRSSVVSAPTPMRLSRERTQVDVRVSDDQKQAIYDQLVMQEQQRQIQIAMEQSKQQEMLKRRLENRVNKRETEAAALFSLGERQKTILEKSQKDERDRQIAQMQERVTRMRESRSKSPKTKPIKEEEE